MAGERPIQWLNPTGVKERLVVRARLELITPTQLGSGDTSGLVDMPLLRDPIDAQPIISSSTLAGALRAHLARIEPGGATRLFGNIDHNKQSRESWVRVGNAHLVNSQNKSRGLTELRDGVAINSANWAAASGLKYDLELLQAGTQFEVDIELLLPEGHFTEDEKLFFTALKGLTGQIRLGKRKRRGFGEIKLVEGKVWRYQFPKDLVRWLERPLSEEKIEWEPSDLKPDLPTGVSELDCVIEVECTLAASLVICSAPGGVTSNERNLPDQEMIYSNRRVGQAIRPVMILPGTSLAGALRARAERIANTLYPGTGKSWAARLFGAAHEFGDENNFVSSRLWVDEVTINQPNEWVHTRVKIDRFTGGAYPGGLFSEGLLMPSDRTSFTLRLRLERAKKEEIGLLLLVLKDLWTGDLPIGGEAAVGRGRLQGRHATIIWRNHEWTISTRDGKLRTTTPQGEVSLEALAKSFSGGNS